MPKEGQKCVSLKWLITENFVDEKKIKVQFVARGFEEDHLEKLCTDSPYLYCRKFACNDDYNR